METSGIYPIDDRGRMIRCSRCGSQKGLPHSVGDCERIEDERSASVNAGRRLRFNEEMSRIDSLPVNGAADDYAKKMLRDRCERDHGQKFDDLFFYVRLGEYDFDHKRGEP